MGFILRLPSINAFTNEEKIEQIRIYLYQTVKDIEYSLNSLDSTNAYTVEAREVDGNSIFSVIKPMIVKSGDILNAYYNIIKDRLGNVFVAKTDMTHKDVDGSIKAYALMCENGMTLIKTSNSTQDLPVGWVNCVGIIHKVSDNVVLQITDLETGSIATNTYVNNGWIGWKQLIPE